MKMVIGIIRPEKVQDVNNALAQAGYNASTKWSVAGRGKQRGIQIGDVVYEEMAKNLIMVNIDDDSKDEVVDIIMQSAISGENGNFGDGKIFVIPVEEAYTISSQSKDEV